MLWLYYGCFISLLCDSVLRIECVSEDYRGKWRSGGDLGPLSLSKISYRSCRHISEESIFLWVAHIGIVISWYTYHIFCLFPMHGFNAVSNVRSIQVGSAASDSISRRGIRWLVFIECYVCLACVLHLLSV